MRWIAARVNPVLFCDPWKILIAWEYIFPEDVVIDKKKSELKLLVKYERSVNYEWIIKQ